MYNMSFKSKYLKYAVETYARIKTDVKYLKNSLNHIYYTILMIRA